MDHTSELTLEDVERRIQFDLRIDWRSMKERGAKVYEIGDIKTLAARVFVRKRIAFPLNDRPIPLNWEEVWQRIDHYEWQGAWFRDKYDQEINALIVEEMERIENHG